MRGRPKAMRLVGVAATLSLTLVAGSARADVTSALSWVRLPGSESCITAPELGTRVEKHLGRSVLVSPSVAEVSIEGRVEAVGSGAARRYRIVVGGTRRAGALIGTRELRSTGADCRALDDDLVLVVALMIDPDALAPAPSPVPAPAPAPPALPPPDVAPVEIVRDRIVVREVERDKTREKASTWLVEASVAGAAAFARLPATASEVALGLRAGPSKRAAFQLMLGVLPSSSQTVSAQSVDFTILEGGLAFCPSFVLGRSVDLGGCAGMRVSVVRSRGRDFATNRDVDRGLADIAIGPSVQIALAGRVFALLTGSILVPLVRQQTTATGGDGRSFALDERSALGGEASLGLGLRFSP